MSPVPLGSKGAHGPHVEWSATTVKHGAEAQPVPGKPTTTQDWKRLVLLSM
ncbi:hypothetical protein [Desulfurococcus amylolyticus]|uniref:hypothetical protein n=1 Tax=Desulfurococcus amylolyticus TaxID=94694 RepID=UPI0012FF2C14|nr:hypothetical protein [Desulfurococcus amylolyticus]